MLASPGTKNRWSATCWLRPWPSTAAWRDSSGPWPRGEPWCCHQTTFKRIWTPSSVMWKPAAFPTSCACRPCTAPSCTRRTWSACYPSPRSSSRGKPARWIWWSSTVTCGPTVVYSMNTAPPKARCGLRWTTRPKALGSGSPSDAPSAVPGPMLSIPMETGSRTAETANSRSVAAA